MELQILLRAEEGTSDSDEKADKPMNRLESRRSTQDIGKSWHTASADAVKKLKSCFDSFYD
ncbi:hypothetical protein SAMN05216326_11622 [Nitrosomonas marina]|uniref:Uncharacterized protein n=1 Tax=Nitrosomonas marina TaxID=917 RepID=A0A1I0CUH1_9PROT|nr:hypothetical protein [Nitrosomonas marina]SET22747.1 hypothetical protein SAMN05216326_11622 [Nitrosomonas marina]